MEPYNHYVLVLFFINFIITLTLRRNGIPMGNGETGSMLA